MKLIHYIFSFCAIICGFELICAMDSELVVADSRRFGTIALTKPALSPVEHQLWQLVFRACKSKDSNAIQVVRGCLGTLVKEDKNIINTPYTVTFEGPSVEKFGMENASYTPLVFAIVSKKPLLVQALLDLGAGVDVPSAMGLPLHAGAINDYRKILPILVARGADINAKDEWGQSVLFKVLYSQNYGFFDDLYKYPHLDCTAQDNQGQTPLHYVVLAERPSLTIAKKLVERGANPHIQDRLGHTPLDYAREGGYHDIVALFEGRYVEATEGFLAGTVAAASERVKLAKKKIAVQKSKKTRKKTSSHVVKENEFQEPHEDKQTVSPTKRAESGVEIETVSPTKKIREDLGSLALTAQAVDTPTRRALALAFEDEALSQEPQEQLIGMDRLDSRVLDWFDQGFLAQERASAFSVEQYARSVYYHQIPLEVIHFVLAHGKTEAYSSISRPDDIGTKWYLRGDMIFANHLDNPWLIGRRVQPGYYHCTMDSKGIIYHVGFDPIRDGTSQLSVHLPLALQGQITDFPGIMQGVKHQFTL